MKKLLFISLFAALIAAGCNKDEGPGGQGPKIPGNEIWYTSYDGNIVKPHQANFGGAEIISNTYKNGKGVIKFNAPVIEIGNYAFYECTNLTSITIPDSVTTIGAYAFMDCDGLTNVYIPDSVTTIGYNTFEFCYGLTAFYGKFASEDNRCLIVDGVLKSFAPAGLTEYTIPDGVTEIGVYAFGYCTGLTSINIPNGVTEIGSYAFRDCTGLTSINIPNGVTEIGSYAFGYCHSLTSVTIPDSVTTIGSYAFGYCHSLTSVTIPDSVTTIRYSAFSQCTGLTSVTIPDSVTTIGDYAFYECTNLTSITIPDSVTTIEDYAFFSCRGLTSVYCQATTPPTLGSYVFKYIDNDNSKFILENLTAIYVPRASVEAYKAAENWSDYADLIQPYDF